MPFLFPYLVGGAVAYILFVKKQKPCPAADVGVIASGTDSGSGATCAIADDVLCMIVRLAFKGDAGASEKVKALIESGAVTREQVSACVPKAKLG
jgi:hypothetical protein